MRKRDYIKEIQSNPNVYCVSVCSDTSCPKHINKVDTSKLYLLAYMKDSLYCLDEEDRMKREQTDCAWK